MTHYLHERDEPCGKCGGRGSYPFPTRQVCPACNGDRTKGEACSGCTNCLRHGDGSTSRRCNGTGRIPGDPNGPRVQVVETQEGKFVAFIHLDELRADVTAEFWTKEAALAAARDALL